MVMRFQEGPHIVVLTVCKRQKRGIGTHAAVPGNCWRLVRAERRKSSAARQRSSLANVFSAFWQLRRPYRGKSPPASCKR
jgi:hypothetical protein